ncbi:MAG: prephenate dehydratase [Phycisphaerae bacterium]|jgi:chorismate mutase/prephenate dehydratase
MAKTHNDSGGEKLAELRRRIDELDHQIVDLLNQRAQVVVEVGKTKLADGTPIYSPDREQAVLKRIAELNKGPLPHRTLQAIYRELMSGSFALERPLTIGFLGPEGSFSNLAAQRKFGASVDYRSLADIRAVFEEVARGHCDLGVVPIENNVGGGVVDTLDSFIDAHVFVCAEVLVEVHHNLLANCAPEKIKTIASKPEIFAQCRNWLSTSFKQVDLLPVASSSKAAEMAASQEGLAAIGSTLAAELYGLKIVFANIEDATNNMTRFFVISNTPTKRTGSDKTALMFTTAHRAGALVEVLNVFSRCGINLTNIDTRPSKRRNWEYYFFVDAEGHYLDENFAQALVEAKEHCGELHVLGSFPRAVEPV